MLIDTKGFHAKHTSAQLIESLQSQVDMWRYESHCWVSQEDGRLRCSWCSRERVGNYNTSMVVSGKADPFPLCDRNPAVEQLLKDRQRK